MSVSILEENIPLAEILDVEGFREVCRSFSELYGIGIKFFDENGKKITDSRASTEDHCGYPDEPKRPTCVDRQEESAIRKN